jgi:ubiquinone/menaquinone biosynthesis C-methylase UbiE
MDWHKRYVQQATWTNDLRNYLFKRAGLETAERLLEVGCGTGAILTGLNTAAVVHGLDLQPASLAEAHLHTPHSILACGDAMRLPFANGNFDITLCHFLLLWVHDPLQALREMRRVTRSGGSILALAEPDYTGRVDEPASLAALGRWQAQSLQRQGANPSLGKDLAQLFQQAHIRLIETGRLGMDTGHPVKSADQELEWAVLEADLAGSVPAEEIQHLKKIDENAWMHGERVLYVPTYWAFGVIS